MNRKRTTNRVTRLFTIVALITLLLLAAAPPIYAEGTWTNQAPAAAPPARNQFAMASAGGDQVLLFGGWDGANYLGDTWVYDLSANTWTSQAPALSPSARRSHAMAYLGDDQVLLFGGWNGTSNGETWVYDLSDNTWTNKNPAAGPFARSVHAMSYLGGDQVLLFGGFVDYWGQTWVYDLSDNTWTEKLPATSPSPRLGHAMAYLGGDRVLLFGGQDGMDNGTWVYDLSDNTWTSQGPAAGPPARYDHAMASLGGDQALLFGGWNGANYLGDTWVYDLSDNTWSSHTPAAGPSARARQAMAFIGGDRVLLFGGDTASGYSAETWLAAGFRTNQPPVADAGPDQTVSTLVLVTLDGSGSSDPDGDLLAYLWTQTGGPVVTLDDPTAVTPTFSAPGDPAVLTFTLTVTDSLGLPAITPDEVVITINNQPPVADAGSDQAVNRLSLVTLDGSGSTDPDGDLPLTYYWAQTGGSPVTLSDPAVVSPTFSAPGHPAVLTFTLSVTDSLGLPAIVPDEVVITVQPYRVCLPLTMRQAQFGCGVRGAVARAVTYPE